MNILVTGGAGYVGYSMVKSLASKYPDSQIIVHDNFSKGKLENISLLMRERPNCVLVPWEKADIRDYANFEAVLKEYQPELVVHLAAIVDAFTTNREGKDVECEIVNNMAAVRIAQLCKEQGVKTFIFQSTVSLYSRGEDLTEDSPKEPLSTYGSSKLEAEKKILALNDDSFKVSVIRSATIVGYNPSFRYETIINMLCIRSVYGMNTTIFESALKNPKSYLSLEDEAAAVIFMIDNIDKTNGEVYNVSSFNTDLETVVNAINETGVKALANISREKTINQQVYTINADKIKSLGFVPKGNIREVVKQTIDGVLKRKSSLEV